MRKKSCFLPPINSKPWYYLWRQDAQLEDQLEALIDEYRQTLSEALTERSPLCSFSLCHSTPISHSGRLSSWKSIMEFGKLSWFYKDIKTTSTTSQWDRKKHEGIINWELLMVNMTKYRSQDNSFENTPIHTVAYENFQRKLEKVMKILDTPGGCIPLQRFPVQRFPLQRFPVQRFPLQRVYCSCRYTINTHKTLESKKSLVH